MATKKSTARTRESANVKDSLDRAAQKLAKSPVLRKGQIVLHLSGTGGGDYCFDCAPGKAKFAAGASGLEQGTPLIEVTGSASVIRAILEGKKDPLKQFAAGGLTIRGDLAHFSEIALELGIIDTPL